jgi:hypothetical protein
LRLDVDACALRLASPDPTSYLMRKPVKDMTEAEFGLPA